MMTLSNKVNHLGGRVGGYAMSSLTLSTSNSITTYEH